MTATIANAILSGVLSVFIGYMNLGLTTTETTEPEPEPIVQVEQVQPVETIECGGCGAEVVEHWTVRNMSNTANVEVCKYCYDAILYSYEME